ncbi:uncharacterized protein LOC119677024, partial [Teleopsis dalmanni]|uniref:uncharacterized protein LOC119677024 n=1 Tax=Teleopsis dalmanni TaxID=139649 RepID=UPI0018CCD4FB
MAPNLLIVILCPIVIAKLNSSSLEHHLQRAICTGLIIPTPEVFTCDQIFYDNSYPPNYKMPRQLIHMQPLGLEQDVPEYDMDSSDEAWVNQNRRLDLSPLKFEQMMDRLEKSSGQTVVTLSEAKGLLKQDDEVSIAVYDYWLNKRLKMQHPLILTVKTENRPGASSNNPYLAFRRRTEKMQTRKNRKNDEVSYEKMLKLRRDLQRATTLLEMVRKREVTKREELQLSLQIFEKRVEVRDFSGALMTEFSSTYRTRPAFTPLYTNQYSHHSSSAGSTPTGPVSSGIGNVLTSGYSANVNNNVGSGHLYSSSQYLNSSNLAIDSINVSGTGIRKEKRQYKKRKHKLPRDKQQHLQQQYLAGVGMMPSSVTSGVVGNSSIAGHLPHLHHLHRQSSSPAAIESNLDTEEEEYAAGSGQQKAGSESEEEAPFAFRRKQSCNYHKPKDHLGNWPWESKDNHGFGDPRYRFTLTSLRYPKPRCIGFARRRLGRGGRVIIDRVSTNFDDVWSQLDYTILESTSCVNRVNVSASPPTVIDLPNENVKEEPPNTSVPPVSIKTEPNTEEVYQTIVADQTNADDGIEADFDEDIDEDYENITRDKNYTSALLLRRQRHRKRNRRHWLNNANSLNKGSTFRILKHNSVGNKESKKSTDSFKPIPRHILHRLAEAVDRNLSNKRPKISYEHQNGVAVAEETVVDVNQSIATGELQRTNHRTNNVVLNSINPTTNNNSNSNINNNVSLSDKFNVIKNENTTVADIGREIKQELIDTADDSNEPLSTIQRLRVESSVDVPYDEENVNLKQLSNLIRHTIKKEPVENNETSGINPIVNSSIKLESNDDDDDSPSLNQVADVIRLRNLENKRHVTETTQPTKTEPVLESFASDYHNEDHEYYMGSLSPSSSQRLEICNELLSEIRRDWLHFRPKTPTDELLDNSIGKVPLLNDEQTPLVDWSQQTPVEIELLRVPAESIIDDDNKERKIPAPAPNSFWDTHCDDALFVSNSFKYADLEPDTELLQPVYVSDFTRGSSKSPEGNTGNSNSGMDFNLSGDSLNDINLLDDSDETDENMLDNILQECQIDEIKTLNQATSFWNGILDGEAVDEVTDVDVAAGILDCIDDKKLRNKSRLKIERNQSKQDFGSSNFTILNS